MSQSQKVTRRELHKLMDADPCALWHVIPTIHDSAEAWAWIHGRDVILQDGPVRVRNANGDDFEVID